MSKKSNKYLSRLTNLSRKYPKDEPEKAAQTISTNLKSVRKKIIENKIKRQIQNSDQTNSNNYAFVRRAKCFGGINNNESRNVT